MTLEKKTGFAAAIAVIMTVMVSLCASGIFD